MSERRDHATRPGITDGDALPAARGTSADRAISHDLVERYLPEPLWRRLPVIDRWWRGRMILVLWALGYPLEMAWSYAIHVEGEQATELQAQMAQLPDVRLIADLEATAGARGDGSHLEFVTLPSAVARLTS